MVVGQLRRQFHENICQQIIRKREDRQKLEYLNFADSGNISSRKIARGIIDILGYPIGVGAVKEQSAGGLFEKITVEFIQGVFDQLQHLRPGKWSYSTTQTNITRFDQYVHLAHLERVIRDDRELSSAIGGDYIVKPDIVITRHPVSDEEINLEGRILSEGDLVSTLTPLRKVNHDPVHAILHASISCKWTIRSDRSQNSRTEALNLIRNRKGHLPHVVAVTAEPLPTRIATLALGTGDLDCVYHFALPELKMTLERMDNQDQLDMLMSMIDGRRLRDISDLPFDLAI